MMNKGVEEKKVEQQPGRFPFFFFMVDFSH